MKKSMANKLSPGEVVLQGSIPCLFLRVRRNSAIVVSLHGTPNPRRVGLSEIELPFIPLSKVGIPLHPGQEVLVSPNSAHSAAGCKLRIASVIHPYEVVGLNLATSCSCTIRIEDLGVCAKAEDFPEEEAVLEESRGWFVLNPVGHVPTKIHSTLDSAKKEAERVSEVSGDKTYVLRIEGIVEPTVEMKTVPLFISSNYDEVTE